MSLSLLVFIGLNVLAASSGALFRPGGWYRDLDKPAWRPPDWLFGPVWMVLYGMIAVSGWLVWQSAGWSGAPEAIAVYGVQLVLNALWSAVFFGMRRPDLALAEIVLLWLSIVATILLFQPFSQTAAWLLVPYLIWVSFAAVLNFSVYRRNRPFRMA
ncbi:MAG: TspO/MBR family protein [Minwuia sp.]|uniref:TspO/MBR family protein n=1 Tax=Minwuia sp. TaxID=2493630 RepID=UPI003A8B0725